MSTTKTKNLKRYTDKQLEFLRAGYARMPICKLLPAFNRKFGLSKTADQLRSTFKNHGITCGRKGKDRIHPGARLYTPAQVRFLRSNYAGRNVENLTKLFNQRFRANKTRGQIKTFVHNRGITCGRSGHFEKGNRPWNTGTKGLCKRNSGCFNKGNMPGNTRLLGSERICSKDGFILIKIAERNPYTGAPTRYKHKHVFLWEQAHGPVPAGKVVAFKDADQTHCVIENLMLISRAVLLRLNWKQYKKMPAELKPSILALAKLETKTAALSKRYDEKENG
jgi:hypothetical protein